MNHAVMVDGLPSDKPRLAKGPGTSGVKCRRAAAGRDEVTTEDVEKNRILFTDFDIRRFRNQNINGNNFSAEIS